MLLVANQSPSTSLGDSSRHRSDLTRVRSFERSPRVSSPSGAAPRWVSMFQNSRACSRGGQPASSLVSNGCEMDALSVQKRFPSLQCRRGTNLTIEIADREIGLDRPTYFVADITASHDGELGRALELITLA